MSQIIRTNIAALKAQRQLAKTTERLEQSFQRLSSGLRLNTAKDDAAGLAISERMDANARALTQASRNVADGISMMQTAESSAGEIATILARLQELAVQAANDSNSKTDRFALHREAQELLKSMDQLAASADFNGKRLLDGSVSELSIQAGAHNSKNEAIDLSFASLRAQQIGHLAKTSGLAAYTYGWHIDPTDQTYTVKINGVTIKGSEEFAERPGATFSAYAKARAINASNVEGVRARADDFKATFNFIAPTVPGSLQINGTVIFQSAQPATAQELVAMINAWTHETYVTASHSGNQITLTSAEGRTMDIGAGFAGIDSGYWDTSVRLVSDKTMRIEGLYLEPILGLGSGEELIIVNPDNIGVSSIDLSTRTGALDAIDRLQAAREKVNSQRSHFGGYQNRLESMLSSMTSTAQNLEAARGRLRDTDYGFETAQLVRNQILQQAATAILAQANLHPQSVLALLK